MTTTLGIGSRLSYKGELCTINYIGEIPAWPGVTTYGLEWDNPSRGKHNGTYKGNTYFNCRIPGSGSFMKSNSHFDPRKTFYQALTEQYGLAQIDESLEAITFGAKVVETLGFDKLSEIQSHYDQLQVISLSRKGVYGNPDKKVLEDIIPITNDLDISFNLFDDLSEVVEIARSLPKLSTLNINGNRFWKSTELQILKPVLQLNTLLSSTTLITKTELSYLAQSFPNLREISIATNQLQTEDFVEGLFNLKHLEILDISFNNLSRIPWTLSKISTIKHLDLSSNSITDYDTSKDFDITSWKGLKSIDIRHNLIKEWNTISVLSELLPEVTDLRINGNPVFDQMSADDVPFYLIGIWGNISKLNATTVTDKERTNAELFLMSKVSQGEFDFNLNTPRWKKLEEKHGKHNIQKKKTNELKSRLIELNLIHENVVKKRRFLLSSTVQKFRTSVARQFNLSPKNIDLYLLSTSNTGGIIEQHLNDNLKQLNYYVIEAGQSIKILNR